MWLEVARDEQRIDAQFRAALTTAAVWKPEMVKEILNIRDRPRSTPESRRRDAEAAIARAEEIKNRGMREATLDEVTHKTGGS